MKKGKNIEKSEPMEKQLWKAADKLRKNIDAAEYKHVVLGLIFLKYISGAFEELYEKLKTTPELVPTMEHTDKAESGVANTTQSDGSGVRVLKPPTKKTAQSVTAANEGMGVVGKKVYVIGNKQEPLRVQLSDFLKEIGLEEVEIERTAGKMLALDEIHENPNIHYAFFVVNSQDIAYIMFELGHFVGKLGKGHVMVLHMSDVNFPKEVPGVVVKPIVVKLEEASFAIVKELKAMGYSVTI